MKLRLPSLAPERPRPGRALGWTADDLATLPYAAHWNPRMGPLPGGAREALLRGPLAEPRLPPMADAIGALVDAEVEDGFALTAGGAMHLALRTELPGVTPAMIDWWFGWHSDHPARYKLWHPHAHVHAAWARPPAAGTRGRARYLGATSLVDEYVGSALRRFAIRFVEPASLGLRDPAVDRGADATAICAAAGLPGVPVDGGYLVHRVDRVAGGSVMRSRFWIGPPYVTPRTAVAAPLVPLGRAILRATEPEARALLVHCAEEMAHLATFLPALHRDFHDHP
ncbi:MAG TPA: hypothetical protein VHE35_30885 [Kofleriaceae bacterium]|nr:hypothetical protein [Kofleriaceae bacterium]